MINTTTKVANSNRITQFIHGVPAGNHPLDNSVELWADRNTRDVYFNKNGITKHITELPLNIVDQLKALYFSDTMAVAQLSQKHASLMDQLEAYSFCLYGACDTNADFDNGKLSESENFRCKSGINCPCLKWANKTISINGNKLTYREIQILELIGKGYTDKKIASDLNISISTLDTHKAKLNKKAGVQSKTQLLIVATQQKAIQ